MKNIHTKHVFLLTVPLFLLILFTSGIYAQEAKKVKEHIFSIDAYNRLKTISNTFLIDVRTRAEYQFIGHPEDANLFPYMFMTDKLEKVGDGYEYQYQKNEAFVEEISKKFNKTDNLLIICRDGKRSASAAKELAENGFENVFNVMDGFEGIEFPSNKDADMVKWKWFKNLARQNSITGFKHRRHYGWQWWGLPWTYDMDQKYLYPPDLPKK